MFIEPISKIIWDVKYRYRRNDVVIDRSIEDTWRRVAKSVARAEKPASRSRWQKAFYQILEGFAFLPGGRILAGAGTEHHVTLLNCFVMPIHNDTASSIFTALKEGAQTLEEGGGIGYDFSVIRPIGMPNVTTGSAGSGPVSYMHIWDAMCDVIQSTGARRGAMMAVLRCDHPDVETFIKVKHDSKVLRHFNVSVMVTDEFMRAVAEDKLWPLVFPTDSPLEGEVLHRRWPGYEKPVPCKIHRYISARELWQKIIRSAYDSAEPGVLFADTVNRMNTLWYREQIDATNPCGEIPLPSYGACDLGSINLPKFVRDPFTSKASIDWSRMDEVVSTATRFLDDVLDVSRYPLKAQQRQAMGTRRIGLGLTGLADMFVMLGIRYGSDESIKLSQRLMKRIANVTWQTSIALAEEKKAFPFYDDDYVNGEFVEGLDSSIREALKKHGIRNSHHNTIAPAGTISLLADNVSNGIEPIFRSSYHRNARVDGSKPTKFHVHDYAYRIWKEKHGDTASPPAWVDAGSLDPIAHLAIQGAMQPFIDNAISKTINLPADFPFAQLSEVYTQAYQLGLKGCTVFRPNSITGSILEINAEDEVAPYTCYQCE